MPLSPNEVEAANRAEATSLMIRAGYRVYRPEADVSGEDLIVRTPEGTLRPVQLKSRALVDWKRYGGRGIWMLFPDTNGNAPGRDWYLAEHDRLFGWIKERHGAAPGWNNAWSYARISSALRSFLKTEVLAAVPSQAAEAG